jgi:soluble lytic murein transglycosylase-like protein
MKWTGLLTFLISSCGVWAENPAQERNEAEYYAAAYARHYNVPLEFVRAVIEQESGWQKCAVSSKGAVGLMQLMPGTAVRLNVRNRCDINQNISGGVRYLAWLMIKFHGDLRLVAAAYYVGESTIERRGLEYANPDVVAYVSSIRQRFAHQTSFRSTQVDHAPRSTQ